MKKVLLTTLLAITVVAGAFAKDPKINSVVLATFKMEFKNVTDVSWAIRADYSKAAFILNNKKMEVFYDRHGVRIATSQSISLDELPVNAKRAFAKKFENYTAKEAIFFEGTEESAYYISGENEKNSVIFKINDNGEISLFQKEKN